MKAVRIHQLGGAEGLKVEERPEPAPGPGEVAVRVRAASLNFRDLMVAKGLYNPRIALPAVPLSDGAGEIVGVGPRVTDWHPGDRVAAAFMPGWVSGPPTEAGAHSALGAGGNGMLAEKVVLPASGVVRVPDHLTFEEASTLPCAAVTAWHALVSEGGVKAGDTVLIQGTGGVSTFALLFARMHGARVIATSGSDDKLARVISMGASDGVNYKTTPDWDKAVRGLTGGEGVDHVVEVGGAGTLTKSLRSVKMGGRVAMIGVLTGGAAEVTVLPVLMKNIRVQGIYVGSRAMFEDMNRAITLHRTRPVIDRVFKLDEVQDAYRYMESASHFGKIVVRLA
jgi:NADPH:quinone reductase-like Zn-dependent oxidoreductase